MKIAWYIVKVRARSVAKGIDRLPATFDKCGVAGSRPLAPDQKRLARHSALPWWTGDGAAAASLPGVELSAC
jgi:hypothetical protein